MFDPERFSPEKSIPPFAYMPFGIGSHNCIGSRLGSLQSKLGVLYFLKSYEIRTQKENELTFSRNTITLTPDGEILLEFEKDILWENN